MNKNVLFAAILAFAVVILYTRRDRIFPSWSCKPTVASVTDRTFAIIKPHAVAEGSEDAILKLIEKNGFEIIGKKKLTMNKAQAQEFYAVHEERPFYAELVKMMTSGPVVLMVLKAANAIPKWRALMGATNPSQAGEGTVRHLFGKDIQDNAVHGSDSPENAAKEIRQFFPALLK